MNEFLDTHWIDPERFLGYNKIVYGGVMFSRENSWLSYTEEDDKNVEVLAQEYKEFLSQC